MCEILDDLYIYFNFFDFSCSATLYSDTGTKGTDKARMYMTKSEISILKIKNIKGESKRDILFSLNKPEKICI